MDNGSAKQALRKGQETMEGKWEFSMEIKKDWMKKVMCKDERESGFQVMKEENKTWVKKVVGVKSPYILIEFLFPFLE